MSRLGLIPRTFLLFLLALGGLGYSCAHQKSEDSVETKSTAELNALMLKMMSAISDLQPYMVSEKAFTNKANQSSIAKKLDVLAKLSKKVIHEKSLQIPTYRISGRVLDDHIQETERLFRAGNKKYSRFMLRSTPSACIACHTQGGESAKPLWVLSQNDVKGNSFERAEFLFATRNYVEALGLYNDAIAKYPSEDNDVSVLDVETAITRELSYYLRAQRNYPLALTALQQDLQNKKLPRALTIAMRSWVEELREPAAEKPRSKNPSTESVLKRARLVLDGNSRLEVSAENPRLVDYLIVSGLLSAALQTEPKAASTPELLYWLGVAELSLNQQFFFSLGPLYLKECVTDYPKDPIAKRCLSALEGELKSLYSGSLGLDMPPDVNDEIEQLRNLVKTDS